MLCNARTSLFGHLYKPQAYTRAVLRNGVCTSLNSQRRLRPPQSEVSLCFHVFGTTLFSALQQPFQGCAFSKIGKMAAWRFVPIAQKETLKNRVRFPHSSTRASTKANTKASAKVSAEVSTKTICSAIKDALEFGKSVSPSIWSSLAVPAVFVTLLARADCVWLFSRPHTPHYLICAHFRLPTTSLGSELEEFTVCERQLN
jgi:hypothetical protein